MLRALVRKSFRTPFDRALREALVRLFPAFRQGEMRGMPVVQANNKKEAQ
ncbi:hypothetical protein ABIA54_000822 [Pseudomonas sp. EB276 TE3739]|nr:hypothetical protein [Pseudomonas koreensis]MCP1475086.1 hypothetical protein [Pseudomonas koreensis]